MWRSVPSSSLPAFIYSSIAYSPPPPPPPPPPALPCPGLSPANSCPVSDPQSWPPTFLQLHHSLACERAFHCPGRHHQVSLSNVYKDRVHVSDFIQLNNSLVQYIRNFLKPLPISLRNFQFQLSIECLCKLTYIICQYVVIVLIISRECNHDINNNSVCMCVWCVSTLLCIVRLCVLIHM